MSNYIPFFINLKGKRCIVAGGGKIALRKIENLMEADAEIVCIAREVLEYQIKFLAEKREIVLYERDILIEDCQNAFLIIAATNNKKVNELIYKTFQKENILINSVDDIENSNFIFPAVLKRGLLKIAVSTSGAAPSLAALIRDRLGNVIGEEFKEIMDILRMARERAANGITNSEKRSIFLRNIAALVKSEGGNDIEELKKKFAEMEKE